MKKEKIILARHIADNGDIFVQLPDPLSRAPVTVPEVVPEIKCKAVFSKDPIEHINYKNMDGQFIATAGIHVHEKHAGFTEFLYEKRASDKNAADTISENLNLFLQKGKGMSEGRKAPRKRGNDSPITRKRIACGLTQAQLAEAVGCAQKDISRWEHGTRTPCALTLSKIAKALECTMEDLI